MSTLGLTDLTGVTLLRSDLILNCLLNADKRKSILPADTLQHALSLTSTIPLRRNALQNTLKHHQLSAPLNTDYSLDFLQTWCQRYLERNQYRFEVKRGNEQAFNHISTLIHPAVITAFHLAQCYSKHQFSAESLIDFARSAPPYTQSPRAQQSPELSDNHIHLMGSHDAGFTLVHLLVARALPREFHARPIPANLPEVSAFPLINQGRFSLATLIGHARHAINHLSRPRLPSAKQRLSRHHPHLEPPGSASLRIMRSADQYLSRAEQLLKRYQKLVDQQEYSQAFLLLLIWIFYLHQSGSTETRRQVKILLHVLHILRSYMVMSGNIGLRHFVTFYQSPLRQAYAYGKNDRKPLYREIGRYLARSGVIQLDGKISAATAGNPRELNCLATAMEQHFVTRPQRVPSAPALFHFTAHFIRDAIRGPRHPPPAPDTPRSNRLLLPARFSAIARAAKPDARHLYHVLNNCYGWPSPQRSKRALRPPAHAQRSHRCMTGNLIAALDIAGDEVLVPPEAYAHLIRWLRKQPLPASKAAARLRRRVPGRQRRVSLSIHAGEDFDSLLTGMRRIDETLWFLDMAEGDRLGHALAIGILPTHWAERHPQSLLTLQDLFDDTIWLRAQLTRLVSQHAVVASTIHRLDARLQRLAHRLFDGRADSITPDQHYAAWLRRRAPSPASSQTRLCRQTGTCPDANQQLDHLQQPTSLYTNSLENTGDFSIISRLNRWYQHDSAVRLRGSTVVQLTIENNSGTSHASEIVSRGELDCWQAVQDQQIETCMSRGISIEVNPTSNRIITAMDHLGDHPLFRWNPVDPAKLEPEAEYNRFSIRHGALDICINSDDPALFGSSVADEFDHIRAAAQRYHSENIPRIDEWLSRIQAAGERIFLRCHEMPVITRNPL